MRSYVAVAIAVVSAGAALLGLRWAERWVLFPAPAAPAVAPMVAAGIEQKWLELSDSRVEAFLLMPKIIQEQSVPLLVYAHGNGELVDTWLSEFEPVLATGTAVLLVEYPGYGRSIGTPSEDTIQRALAAGYDWAVSKPNIDRRRVVGYGSSLGGGAICALAQARPLAALVLESTFTSFGDLLAERPAPVAFLRHIVQNDFNNLAIVSTYELPLLVLHGDRDQMIPPSHARRLAEAARLSEIGIMACGHNDCPRPWAALLSFLSRHHLVRPGNSGPAAQSGKRSKGPSSLDINGQAPG